MKEDHGKRLFRGAHQDMEAVGGIPLTEQTAAPAYRLAFADDDFLCRDELRPVRLQLELLKPEMGLDEAGVDSTVVLFGGARIPQPGTQGRSKALTDMSVYYEQARAFAKAITERSILEGGRDWVVTTGGGPGVMEAGNRGASEAGGRSVGLSIVLPHEQAPNAYVTPELCFNFHYFAIRKMHFLMRAKAIAVFPGGFGTFDETFEALTLIQTGRMEQVPFLLFGEAFWRKAVNFEALVEAGTIAEEDLNLFRFVETAEEALAAIDTWDGAGMKRGQIPGR